MHLTWRELSAFPSEPSEELALLTRLNSERPKDEQWLALVAPFSSGSPYLAVSVSLDNGLRFTNEAQRRLNQIASRVQTELEASDIEAIAAAQRAVGNRPLVARVTPHTARFVVPPSVVPKLRADLSSTWDGLEKVVEAEGA